MVGLSLAGVSGTLNAPEPLNRCQRHRPLRQSQHANAGGKQCWATVVHRHGNAPIHHPSGHANKNGERRSAFQTLRPPAWPFPPVRLAARPVKVADTTSNVVTKSTASNRRQPSAGGTSAGTATINAVCCVASFSNLHHHSQPAGPFLTCASSVAITFHPSNVSPSRGGAAGHATQPPAATNRGLLPEPATEVLVARIPSQTVNQRPRSPSPRWRTASGNLRHRSVQCVAGLVRP